MAISNAMATSFKLEMPDGIHAAADVYKALLIKVGATGAYDATLTNVGTPGSGAPSTSNVGTDEASGTGYTSGGITLAGRAVTNQGGTACIDFTSPVWATSSISAIGMVIYNSSKSNKVVGTFSFGGTITSTNGNFTGTMPAVGNTTSVLRVA